jgi:hypothetical protein
MKVAVCLHGYFGTLSTNDFSTSKGGHEHIHQEIVSKCDEVDFYIHCWQPEYEKQIVEYYNPVSYKVEEQIDFGLICRKNNIYQNYIDEYFPRSKTMYKNATAERILSFYYSRCESIKMCLKKDYDWVLTTRFDISQRGGKEVKYIKFLPNADNSYIYAANWNQKNIGYTDMWFYGSPEIMQKYSKIYEQALHDFKPLSQYERCVTRGWPDSNFFNHDDHRDQRQFTNEVDKKNRKSDYLMTFPKWRVTDSHLHHKWFYMQSGLYELTRWV